MKGGTNQVTTGNTNKPQGNVPSHPVKSQPTAEQIRYAKLAQFSGHELGKLQEKIKEVSDVTGKPTDVVSVALHESNYDVPQAIQNIMDGQYECLDTEWQTKPSKKRKPQGIAATGDKSGNLEDDLIENHLNEEEDEKSSIKPNKPSRGGKRGGRSRKTDEKPEEKPAESNVFREKENSQDETGERIRSFDRGRGRARGRGRGGAQRGGSRRGGFGRGGSSFGSGRGGQRGRGRGFGRRPRQDRDGKASASEANHEGSSENVSTEKESWDIDDGNEVERGTTDWAFVVEAEQEREEWSDNQWPVSTQVSEDNTATLFAISMIPSSSQSENWSHANGPDTSWGRTSPSRQQPQEESLYRPENVDTAVIKSQRAEPASKQDTYSSPEQANRSTYTSTLHNNKFPSSHPTSSIASSILGRSYNLETLAKATTHSAANESSERATATTMISGIHDSHKLEQEQIQPAKSQKQPKPKKATRSQVPLQPVEMPKSFMEEIEQQLGGLEFGSGPSISPQFGSESTSAFGPPATAAVTTVFQQSSPPNITSTIHAESVRHSVAVPETSAGMSSVASIPSSISTKTDRPKTPPGLKSLQDHQSPGRSYVPPSSIDINRIVQMTDSIGYGQVTRSSVPSLPVSTPISATNESLQTPLDNSYTGTRMNHDVGSNQDTIVSNVTNDQRPLSNQTMMGLGASTLQNHLQQKQPASAFSTVSDAYRSQTTQNKATDNIQSETSVSFSKPNVSPVPGGNSQVTYASATLASHVLGYQSTTSTASTQTSIRTQATTSKTTVSGPHGMMPVNMYPGMQQGMMLPPYTTYSYGDMVVPRLPVANYYDMVYQNPTQNRESTGSSFQAGDSKFGRDASSPVASSINTGNIHAAHAQQFLGAAAAAAAPMHPYGYAYYSHNVIPGTFPVFTAPPTQMQAGKGNIVGTHYQSGYTSPHNSQVYNSAGGSQEFGKGAYHQTATQSLQHTKTNQGTGSLGGASLSADTSHHSGYKSQFNQDSKGYQLTQTPPSMGMQMQHAQNHMTNYTQYMMQHHTQLMHQATGHLGHQQLDSSGQGSHSMTGSQQPKREAKGQGYRSSIWSATN